MRLIGAKTKLTQFPLGNPRHFREAIRGLLRKKVPEPRQTLKFLSEAAAMKVDNMRSFKQLSQLKKNLLASQKLKRLLKFRALHVPIQYLCGEWPFIGLQLEMRRPVLIPRQETEQMMRMLFESAEFEQLIRPYQQQSDRTLHFVELGCGTGAIGLSLAKYLTMKGVKCHGTLIDIDPRAVKLTQKNVFKNEMQQNALTVVQQDLEEFLSKMEQIDCAVPQLMLSNPPYISAKQYDSPRFSKQVRKYESQRALVGDRESNLDGLYYIERIVSTWKRINQRQRCSLVLEYGGECLKHLGEEIEGGVVEDYYSKRRFVMIF